MAVLVAPAKIQSVNPATEEVNAEFELYDKKRVIEICKSVSAASGGWSSLGVAERAEHVTALRDKLKSKRKEYAKLMTQEMGKPVSKALAEIDKCAWMCDILAERCGEWLADEHIETEAKKSYVTFEPLGTILGIMPWNYPFWQAFRYAVPAMLAGNTCVLRHSNAVPLCALAIEEAFGGFPPDAFRTIITDYRTVSFLIRSSYVQGVSLTGSVEAGSAVAAQAGRSIKKFVLELGGSDPFVVLEDALLPDACSAAADARTLNAGQSCVAAKRFIVVKKVADEFVQRLVERTKALKVGDPLSEETQIGPMANRQQFERILSQVEDARQKGATVECGGSRIGSRGFFFEPAVLTNVSKKMRVLREEVFGPVAPVIVAKDEKQALRIANDTPLGLGASVWTQDAARGERFARALQAGIVYVNGIVRSDPRMPFGGVKKSGIGRELGSHGIREFTNVKSVIIK